MYLTLCTRWLIVQNANRFSDKCNYYEVVEGKLATHRSDLKVLVDRQSKYLSITVLSTLFIISYYVLDILKNKSYLV